MGHLVSKDIYRALGKKIDSLTMRAPWNDALYQVVRALYTEEEADVMVRMPYSISRLDRVSKVTGYSQVRLIGILERMADKGLVLDLYDGSEYQYMPSPMVVGIFEFTMMRTRGNLDTQQWARLLHGYLEGNPDFFRANYGDGQKTSIARALPHRDTIAPEEVVEILPFEKAEAIAASHDKFAIGICSCRHTKLHNDLKKCNVPLETCTSFGYAADYLIRHGMAKEVCRGEILANLEQCRELGLVFSADNVQKNVTFICCCCSCCCELLQGITRFGFSNALMTSSFIARVDSKNCRGCGKCAGACPINAISLKPADPLPGAENRKNLAEVDGSICLGCGVCALKCDSGALWLHNRQQKVIFPETTFERNILSCLEKGTLQHQIFDNPQTLTHKVMRGMLGGFLRLNPVKKALMSDLFRSRFLAFLATASKQRGYEWITRL